jgi:hypothetical protein
MGQSRLSSLGADPPHCGKQGCTRCVVDWQGKRAMAGTFDRIAETRMANLNIQFFDGQ